MIPAIRQLLSSLLTAAALFPAAAVPAEGEGHAQHAGGTGSRAAKSALGASAAFDAAGRLWAIYVEGQQLRLRGSDDLGRTWSAAQVVNSVPEPVAADGDSFPKLAAGPAGELYATWSRPLAKPYTGEIRFARSMDGGQTFSAPITVHADRQEITHRFDALRVDAAGRIFVAWIDKRDLESAKKQGRKYRGAAVYFSVSEDGGRSFRGDFKVADHACECCRLALSDDGTGGTLLMWRHVFEPNIRDHALVSLGTDGRVSHFRRATFDDWRLDACPHHGPSLAVDGAGRLHAVWFSSRAGKAGVFHGRLQPDAVLGQRELGDGRAEHADLIARGDTVVVAWKEFDGKSTRVLAQVSKDAGLTWADALPLAATAGASDQPRLLMRGARTFVFWHTRDEGLRLLAVDPQAEGAP